MAFWQKRKTGLIAIGLWLLALIPRIVGLGTFLTIDEIKWIEGAGQFALALQAGDLSQTYWHFFPGVTIAWGDTLVLWLGWLLNGGGFETYVATQVADPVGAIGLFRLSGAFLTALFAPGVYLLGRRIVDDWAASLTGALIALNPFLLAHSRIVNGDAVAAGLMFLSTVAFIGLWLGSRLRAAVLSGVLAGLALLTKLPAPLIAPVVGLLAIIGWWQDRKAVFWLKTVLIWGLAALLICVVLWPALWVDPAGTLQRMWNDTFEVGEAGEGHSTFYLGQEVNDPGWGFYPYAVAFRLTPITLVGLLLLLLIFRGDQQDNRIRRFRLTSFALLIYVLFVYAFSSLSPKKLDRYVMAVFPALDMLAAIGYAQLVDIGSSNLRLPSRLAHLKSALWVLIVVCLATVFVMPYYPYYLTYYNPLLGGATQAVREVPVGWGEGLEQAAAWLNAQPGAEHLRVAAWYSDIFFPYFVGEQVSFSSSGKSQLAADYVVFYINQVQRQKPDPGLVAYFQAHGPSHAVAVEGVGWAWVYPAPRMMYEVSGQTQIEGRAWLLGYSAIEDPQPGESLPVTLYFRVLGDLPPTETFDVRLVASDDQFIGEWQSVAPRDAWVPGAVIEWRGTLTLPGDLPPGDYRLDVGLSSVETGSPLARFAWSEAEEGWLSVMGSED